MKFKYRFGVFIFKPIRIQQKYFHKNKKTEEEAQGRSADLREGERTEPRNPEHFLIFTNFF